jgi:two-component system OmpR family sensor kinase
MGVQVLRTQAPPSVPEPEPEAPPVVVAAPSHHGDPGHHVEASLDALDDVMRMLSNLNQRAPTAPSTRRGRIDVAALLFEIAPDARVHIEPGSGTEVFGDEADLRRMLQVLVGHGSGLGSNVVVRGEGDDVRVTVSLGPDASPTAETERIWLSRMALRYGGRHELEGGSEVLVFPAEEAAEATEREKLRKELDEARRQGAASARELAAMFDRGEEVTKLETVPPPRGAASDEHLAAMIALARRIARDLDAALAPLSRALDVLRPGEVTAAQLESLRGHAASARATAADLASFGADSSEASPILVDPSGSPPRS